MRKMMCILLAAALVFSLFPAALLAQPEREELNGALNVDGGSLEFGFAAESAQYRVLNDGEGHESCVEFANPDVLRLSIDGAQVIAFDWKPAGNYDSGADRTTVFAQTNGNTYYYGECQDTPEGWETAYITVTDTADQSYIDWKLSEGNDIKMLIDNVRAVSGEYDVTLEAWPVEGGSVTGGGTGLAAGSIAAVQANAAEGYVFAGWEFGGRLVSEEREYRFPVGQYGTFAPLRALFYRQRELDQSLNVLDGTLGFTTGGDGIWEAKDGFANTGFVQLSYAKQYSTVSTKVTGPAVLTFEWKLEGIASGLSGQAEFNLLIDGIQTASCGGTDWNEKRIIIEEGPHSIEWAYLKHAGIKGERLEAMLRNVEAKADTADVVVSTQDVTVGNVSGGGEGLPVGSTVTVLAQSAPGYVFSHWAVADNDSDPISGNEEYSFVLRQDIALVAVFLPDSAIGTLLNETPATFDFVTEGNLAWGIDSSLEDAAFVKSMATANDMAGESSLETTVTGPMVIYFDWMATSLSENEKFVVSLDGEERVKFGEYETVLDDRWRRSQIAVPSGEHTIKWIYQRGAFSGGATGIKNIRRTTGTHNVALTVLPSAGGTVSGVTFGIPAGDFTTLVATSHEGYRFLRWEYGRQIISEESTLVFTPGQWPAQEELRAVFEDTVPLSEAINASGSELEFVTQGTNLWYNGNDSGSRGRYGRADLLDAAGKPANDASLRTTVTGPAVLSFDWMVSARQDGDVKLELKIDGVLTDSLRTRSNWTAKIYTLSDGEHTVEWVCTPITLTPASGDYAGVDNVKAVAADKTAVSVRLSKLPKRTYQYGESLSITGGQIAVTMSDGSVETYSLTTSMVSGYRPYQYGTQTLTVTYTGTAGEKVYTYYTVTVNSSSGNNNGNNNNGGGYPSVSTPLPVQTPLPTAKPQPSNNRYISGYEDGTFGPENASTRAEVVTVLARVFDLPDAQAQVMFTDVDSAHWAYDSIVRTAAAGYIRGFEDGSFGPDENITRADFAIIMGRRLGAEAEDAPQGGGYTDTVGHYAERYIRFLQAEGYLSGYEDGTFRPDAGITRAEMVTVINRIVGIAPNPGAPPVFSDLPADHWAYGAVMAVLKRD